MSGAYDITRRPARSPGEATVTKTKAVLPVLLLAGGIAAGPGCGSGGTPEMGGPYLTQGPFGATPDGQPIDLVTLRNTNGIEVRIATYGGTVVSVRTPDRDGNLDDIVLGFDTIEPYFTESPYFGPIIGRHANRIANARFDLDGETYTLTANDGPHHLHGGTSGWDKAVWRSEPFQNVDGVGVVLRHVSPAGDQGYPGTVEAAVTYWLTGDNRLVIAYEATTDAPTVVNMTHHSYFNLAGGRAPDVLGHTLMIAADRYAPTDPTGIPTGEVAAVEARRSTSGRRRPSDPALARTIRN